MPFFFGFFRFFFHILRRRYGEWEQWQILLEGAGTLGNNPTCNVVYFALGLSYWVYHTPCGRGRLSLVSGEISLILRVSQLV